MLSVALPLSVESVHITVDKGRAWTRIEHALLLAINDRDRSVDDLIELSGMPRSIVAESLLRLMRAGWLHILTADGETRFRLTKLGKSIVDWDQLPSVVKRVSRDQVFIVELVEGRLYRNREFKHIVWKDGLDTSIPIAAESAGVDVAMCSSNIEEFLGDDEALVDFERDKYAGQRRYAIVTVDGGVVSGLPDRAPSTLKTVLYNTAKSVSSEATGAIVSIAPSFRLNTGREFSIRFDTEDLVTRAGQHKQLFATLVGNARRQAIIHSTFLNPASFADALPVFQKAIGSGARIDVLWGQDTQQSGGKESNQIADCRKLIAARNLDQNLFIHKASTLSHGKFIVCDSDDDRYRAAVGSCNWLASRFNKFETTVKFRDPHLIAHLLEIVAGSVPGTYIHTEGDFLKQLLSISQRLREESPPETHTNATAQLLFGDDHNRKFLEAVEAARHRFLCVSHRVSPLAKNAVLAPLSSERLSDKVDCHLFFENTKKMRHGEVATLTKTLLGKSIRAGKVPAGTIHGKFLAWDNHDIVVTSQNWLSCVSSVNQPIAELGIHICKKGIGQALADRFHQYESNIHRQGSRRKARGRNR